MATYTATSFLRSPRLVHAGVNATTFRYNLGATASSNGDVILLAKVPFGTTITELVESHTTGATTQALSFGLDANLSSLIASGAQATANRLSQAAIGTTVTGSDDAVARYSILKAKVESGTATTSLIINGTVFYTVGD